MIETVQNSVGSLWELIAYISSFVVSQTIANINDVATGIASGGTDAIDALLPLTVLILQFSLVLTTLKVLHMTWTLLHEVQFMWRKPKSYSVQRGGGKRILIIGDSTAYGLGADKPEDTIAGRLGHDFPQTDVINTAVNGSLTKNAINQLHKAEGTFDLIIISTGGNDIVNFTRLSSLERDLTRLLEEAIEKSWHRVILLFYANLGGAPIFPSVIRSLLRKRTEKIHEMFSRVTTALHVPLVELYIRERIHEFDQNPFTEEPEKYYAKDRMHPNSEGYRLWYNRMWGEMVARNLKFKE